MAKERVLITGCNGFLGSALRVGLEGQGHKVTGFSNSRPAEIVGDLRSYADVERAVAGADRVFHLGGISSALDSDKNPIADFEINALGTFNVLRAAQKARVQKVVFTSSAYVYGKPEKLPIKETAQLKPTSYYGQSKLVAEEYCRYFSRKGVDVSIARIFNAFGKGQENRVIPDLISRMSLPDGTFTLKGNSADSRDFLSVSQVVDALILLGNSGKSGEAYNVGSGKETQMKELAELIRDAFARTNSGFKKQIRHNFDARTSQRNQADVSKLKALGFRPTPISIRQVLGLMEG